MQNKKVHDFRTAILEQVQPAIEKAIKDKDSELVFALTNLLHAIDYLRLDELEKDATDICGTYTVGLKDKAFVIKIEEEGTPILIVDDKDGTNEYYATKIKNQQRSGH